MTPPVLTRVAGALIVILAVFAVAPPIASGQDAGATQLELRVLADASVGDEVSVEARLTVDGTPLPDAEIVFYRSAEFFNTGGDLLMGRERTDQFGTARVMYHPRSEGEMLIMAEFDGVAGVRAVFAETTVVISPGPAQYTQEVGVSGPGINVFFLVAILSGVWGTYLVVMSLIWRIARDGSMTSVSGGAPRE